MTAANDNGRPDASRGAPLFATTMRLLSSLDAMPDRKDVTEPRRAERS